MSGSFVICFHTARIDNLLQTLRFLISDHHEVVAQSQLEAVCQDSINNLPHKQFEELDILRECFYRSTITDMSVSNMHLPRLTNFAIEQAENDKIVVLESDRILPAGYFAKVFDELREGVQISCAMTHKLAAPATDEQIETGDFFFKEDARATTNHVGKRNVWSGNTAIWRPDWERAGRMDEFYNGYGWADTDMAYAMDKIGVETVMRPEIELHLWHPPATYGTGDQKQMFIDNGIHFCKKWNEPFPAFLREEIAKRSKILL